MSQLPSRKFKDFLKRPSPRRRESGAALTELAIALSSSVAVIGLLIYVIAPSIAEMSERSEFDNALSAVSFQTLKIGQMQALGNRAIIAADQQEAQLQEIGDEISYLSGQKLCGMVLQVQSPGDTSDISIQSAVSVPSTGGGPCIPDDGSVDVTTVLPQHVLSRLILLAQSDFAAGSGGVDLALHGLFIRDVDRTTPSDAFPHNAPFAFVPTEYTTVDAVTFSDSVGGGGGGEDEDDEDFCPFDVSEVPTCQDMWASSNNFLDAFCCLCSASVGGVPNTHPDCACCGSCLVWDFTVIPPALVGNNCDSCPFPTSYPGCEIVPE